MGSLWVSLTYPKNPVSTLNWYFVQTVTKNLTQSQKHVHCIKPTILLQIGWYSGGITHLHCSHFAKFYDDKTKILNLLWQYLCLGGLDLSREILWVSASQRAAKLWSLKLWRWSIPYLVQEFTQAVRVRFEVWLGGRFFQPSNLTAYNFATFWPTDAHNTSLERSKPLSLHSINLKEQQDFKDT